jgi:hypothetical protein
MALSKSERIFGRYSTFVNQGYDRIDVALGEARARKYSPTSLMSDMITAWADAIDMWCFPWKLVGEAQPIVEFNISTSTTSAVAVTRIPQTTPFTVGKEDLAHDDPARTPIQAAKVLPEISSSGEFLIVRLQGLTGLVAGRYSGRLKDPSNNPFAVVIVNVA